ncbi:MAG: ATPase domain-containing protein, partial [Candidatus Saccharimonadales bacterium]
MPRVKTIKPGNYICSNCGSTFSSWSGRCEQCGEWNTLELRFNDPLLNKAGSLKTESITQSNTRIEQRLNSGIASVDSVFGGGLVEGSVSLLSGEPGMGKSTLLLQLASAVAKSNPVLYVSGEESIHQLAARAKRLKADEHGFSVASTNSAEDVAGEILSAKYKLVIVDSIQTMRSEQVGSTAGSITQVTNSSALLSTAAKQSNTALLIVGHVTKDGNIAGPKLLEHAVDTVLSLEGDPSIGLKLLRVNKNRFGSTNETAIFEMRSNGLMPVLNPSALLLAERQASDGSVVLAAIEGSRPILVE